MSLPITRQRHALPRGRPGAARAALMLAVALTFAACGADSDPVGLPANISLSAMPDTELGAILTDMTASLGLDEGQEARVVAIGEAYSDRIGEPGIAWEIAAKLQEVLNSRQVEQLAADQGRLRERVRELLLERYGDGPPGPGSGGFGFGAGPLGVGGGPLAGFLGAGETPVCARLGHLRDRFGGRLGLGGLLRPGMVDALGLSQEQIEAFRAILLEYGPQVMDLMRRARDGELSEEQFRQRAQELADEIERRMTRLLTREQLRKLEQLRERLRESAETARAARIRALGLTGSQLEALEALRERFARRTCETLVAGQSPEELRAAHQAALREILTDRQLEVLAVHAALRLHFLAYRLENGGPAEDFAL